MLSRATSGAIVACAVALGLGALGACVLADPPAALPTTPVQPPRILQATPPVGVFLEGAIPTQFVVEVAVDPTQTQVECELFIDSPVAVAKPGGQDVAGDGGPTLITVDDPSSPAPQECHTIQITVFYPNALDVGTDTVTWFYSPTGSFDGCPIFDAGTVDASDAADGASVDASTGSD